MKRKVEKKRQLQEYQNQLEEIEAQGPRKKQRSKKKKKKRKLKKQQKKKKQKKQKKESKKKKRKSKKNRKKRVNLRSNMDNYALVGKVAKAVQNAKEVDVYSDLLLDFAEEAKVR